MKTYFIHGKITPTGFHLTATQLKKPPRGYYLIGEQIAPSTHSAIRIIVETRQLQPPRGMEFQRDIQSSFV